MIMSTQRDHMNPLLEEIPITSSGEEIDPKVLDHAMKINKKMFLKMKEEDEKRAEEENQEERPKKTKEKEKSNTMMIW
jgi:predicted RNA-binding protein with RPS1 domain